MVIGVIICKTIVKDLDTSRDRQDPHVFIEMNIGSAYFEITLHGSSSLSCKKNALSLC